MITLSDVLEVVAIVLGAMIVLYAIIAFIYRLLKGEPFWPSFKKMVRLVFEGIMGIG